ncbi:hypothetical protein Tco_0749512 [Tanacetum coccineum]|uniref:Uncharacterized protein n=1 Tax=Tanacetum coccineum TaxID=301880 RepID=A0ABQ4YZM5_9ASTR
MPSPRPAAYSPKEVMYRYYHTHLTSGDGFDPESKSKIPYDLEDLRACFQSSNHSVSDHLLVISWEILNPDHIYIDSPFILGFFAFVFFVPNFDHFLEIPSSESKVHIDVLSVLWRNRLPNPDGSLPLSRSCRLGRLMSQSSYKARNSRLIKVYWLCRLGCPMCQSSKRYKGLKTMQNDDIRIRFENVHAFFEFNTKSEKFPKHSIG